MPGNGKILFPGNLLFLTTDYTDFTDLLAEWVLKKNSYSYIIAAVKQ